MYVCVCQVNRGGDGQDLSPQLPDQLSVIVVSLDHMSSDTHLRRRTLYQVWSQSSCECGQCGECESVSYLVLNRRSRLLTEDP